MLRLSYFLILWKYSTIILVLKPEKPRDSMTSYRSISCIVFLLPGKEYARPSSLIINPFLPPNLYATLESTLIVDLPGQLTLKIKFEHLTS